jgi:hypothetical protein
MVEDHGLIPGKDKKYFCFQSVQSGPGIHPVAIAVSFLHCQNDRSVKLTISI